MKPKPHSNPDASVVKSLMELNEKKDFNNFSIKEKKPILKINLRGDPNNKDFSSKVGKILGIIGMVLGFYANSQGDSRGVAAGIVSLICMILGMFIGMLMWSGTY